MKKRWITALATLMVAGVATTALGEGILKISIDSEKVGAELPASSASAVQTLVEKMGGFSTYDSETGKLVVEKPNVNMLVLEGIQQYRNKDLVFTNPIKGWLDKDIPRSFGVFVEVDNAPVSNELILEVRLVGPNGRVIDAGKERTFSTRSSRSFYFSQPFISTKLDQYGIYKVQLWMKRDKRSPYTLVGENRFTVGR